MSWRLVTHYVFSGFLTPVLAQRFFPKPPTSFLTYFCKGKRRKYAGKKKMTDSYWLLVVLGFNATLIAKVMSWRLVTHYVFSGFLTPVLAQLLFPKPPTSFLTYFCKGKSRKYAGKKSRLNRGSNSQPPGHESDKLITEPPGRG